MEYIKALLMDEDNYAIIQGIKTRLILDSSGFTVLGKDSETGNYFVELYHGTNEKFAVMAFEQNE